jgi:hypothetical protein
LCIYDRIDCTRSRAAARQRICDDLARITDRIRDQSEDPQQNGIAIAPRFVVGDRQRGVSIDEAVELVRNAAKSIQSEDRVASLLHEGGQLYADMEGGVSEELSTETGPSAGIRLSDGQGLENTGRSLSSKDNGLCGPGDICAAGNCCSAGGVS